MTRSLPRFLGSHVMVPLAGRLILPALFLLSLAAAPAAAQREAAPSPVTLRGQVIDHQTGQPLSGAVVEIGTLKRREITDEKGLFSFRRVKPGTHFFSVTQLGYAGETFLVEIEGEGGEIRVGLRPDAVMLEGITVKLNVLERRRRSTASSSRTFDRRWIASSAAPNMQEFVRSHAGIYAVPCTGQTGGANAVSEFAIPMLGPECVYSRGSAAPVSVVIDEAPALGLSQLTMFNPSEVHRVEVYDGGRHIRIYTTWFMEQVARGRRRISPAFW